MQTMDKRTTIIILLSILFSIALSRRIRLPILLRSPKIECNLKTDECGINKSLDQFTLYSNSSYYIAGRCEYYQFNIDSNGSPNRSAKFETMFFPNLESRRGCLHLEDNVQGRNTFILIVHQRTRIGAGRVIYTDHVVATPYWSQRNIEVSLGDEEESQFIVQVLCQYCSPSAKYSISRISFKWEACNFKP